MHIIFNYCTRSPDYLMEGVKFARGQGLVAYEPVLLVCQASQHNWIPHHHYSSGYIHVPCTNVHVFLLTWIPRKVHVLLNHLFLLARHVPQPYWGIYYPIHYSSLCNTCTLCVFVGVSLMTVGLQWLLQRDKTIQHVPERACDLLQCW